MGLCRWRCLISRAARKRLRAGASNTCGKASGERLRSGGRQENRWQEDCGLAETYFDPGERRAAKVNELFTKIAPRYDLINDLQSFGLHRRWKRRVVDLARPRPGESALDLCCGTGDLAFALALRGVAV